MLSNRGEGPVCDLCFLRVLFAPALYLYEHSPSKVCQPLECRETSGQTDTQLRQRARVNNVRHRLGLSLTTRAQTLGLSFKRKRKLQNLQLVELIEQQ